MNGVEKIRSEHRERQAFVYVRQSTMAQVIEHRTSTERQCELTQLAERLGWAPAQVELVNEDLGRSGRFSEERRGFQRLAAAMGLGRAGAVFSLDASRLARSSADWHRLLEIAGLTRTLLVDEQTVYDPRDPNDRLLLGMKGTMADFELVWLRQRMEAGRWHLARKGELRVCPPAGYVYEGDRLVMDPDEEVRRAVALLFERYRVAGSCTDIVRYFIEHKVRFPARVGARVTWRPLTHARVSDVLHNPVYAGAYVYGRRHCETILVDGQRLRREQRFRPISEWPVMRRDAHAGYIGWEEYVTNQKRLADGGPRRRWATTGHGAVREGAALLQGLLLCGRCSNRVTVSYGGQNGRYPAYDCSRLMFNAVGDRCLRVPSRYVDSPVVELVLQTLTREHLEAATRVVEIIEQEDVALDQQWKLRIERARYEAKRAERQYDACDPENRVVARTLEKRWNDALVEADSMEREFEDLKQRRRQALSEIDRQRIVTLADDLPRLWRAKTTTDRDRKMLLRLLIQEVSVHRIDVPHDALRLRVLWHTQAVTEIEAERPRRRGGPPRPPVPWRIIATTAPTKAAS